MSPRKPDPAREPEVFVLAEGGAVQFPDLDLLLPAGVVVCIPESHLARVLQEPSVAQVFPHEQE